MADDPQFKSTKTQSSGADTAENSQCNATMTNRPPNRSPGQRDTYWFAHAGGEIPADDGTDPNSPDGGGPDMAEREGSPTMTAKDREERIRHFREKQEEDRNRKLQELQQQNLHAQQYRELQENERRRKLDEMRMRDQERRQQVEERKRLIWEAEHERKAALLKRNMERESKIEARRNAHRNSMSFAFGSSTPRTFDLDLATLGAGVNSAVLMSAQGTRKSEEREMDSIKKRATSAYNLSQAAGEDPMSRSMISLPSSSRGRKKTDLMPVIPWNRNSAPRSKSPGTSGPAKRAVSMSRLDILAQPRRRFTEPNHSASGSTPKAPAPPSMSAKSMLNLAHPSSRHVTRGAQNSGTMSRSMMHLGPPQLTTVNRRPVEIRVTENNTSPRLRQAQSMSHLAVLPRPTRASQLRASKLSGSMMGINVQVSPHPAQKEHQSPSRPRSSMSTASDHSMTSSHTSTVSLRPRVPPRKPRPTSIAGSVPDKPLSENREPSRQSRPLEKRVTGSADKALRARSTGPEPALETKPLPLRKPHKPQPPFSSPSRKDQKASSTRENNKPAIPPKPQIIPGAAFAGSTPTQPSEQSKTEDKQESQSKPASAEPSPPKEVSEASREQQPSPENSGDQPAQSKHRIISEEEAKAALAEKRRLAREQAEREAELERQRQEELRRLEEERRRQEEEEQRRMEEEQIRLAEEHRRQEEEKLRKAIEEQQKREAEEKLRREQEALLKAEREEQEKKAREEAERQRKELEEKLRREEAERAERKKRVEEIMARTRKRNAAKEQAKSSPESEEAPSEDENKKEQKPEESKNEVERPTEAPTASVGTPAASTEASSSVPVTVSEQNNSVEDRSREGVCDSVKQVQVEVLNSNETTPLNTLVLDTVNSKSGQEYPFGVVPMEQSPLSKPATPEMADFVSELQTNGYVSHESNTSLVNGLSSTGKVDNLVDLESSRVPIDAALIDVGTVATNNSREPPVDNLLNSDDINSNRVSSNQFIAFEEENRNTKTQEPQFTDLLS